MKSNFAVLCIYAKMQKIEKAYSIKLQEQESMAEDLICWKHKKD